LVIELFYNPWVFGNEILLKFSVQPVKAYAITYLLHNGLVSLYT